MIGIIGAMEEEIAQLKKLREDVRTEERASMTFYSGTLEGVEAVIVKSGIGKVNMAVCAQILVDLYQVTAMINTGVAGSLDNRLDIGDIALAGDAVQHDVDTSVFGDAKGQVPRMDTLAFPGDERLNKLAAEANEAANPDTKAFIGRILSGDQFVYRQEDKYELVKEFGGLCCEMEGAAMAQAAYLNHVPCLIIRAISDKSDHSATMEYAQFEKLAISRTTRLLLELLKRL